MKRFALVVGLCALFVPRAAFSTPIDCGSPTTACSITTTPYAWVAPVTIVTSGTSVVWTPTSDDFPHVPADGEVGSSCFQIDVQQGLPVAPVRFDIVSGSVQAIVDPGQPDQTISTCATAIALPAGGAYVLPYHCLLHAFMRGVFVIH
ncbi:MAG: hypothetical protein ACYDCC_07290 [Actinomycetota bacterium]